LIEVTVISESSISNLIDGMELDESSTAVRKIPEGTVSYKK